MAPLDDTTPGGERDVVFSELDGRATIAQTLKGSRT